MLIKFEDRDSRLLYEDLMTTDALLWKVIKPGIRLAQIKELIEFEQYCRAHAAIAKVGAPKLI